MSTGVVASVQCPACGQFFLCQQHAAEGLVTCPHCAHQGLRGSFPTQGHTAGLTAVRRQVFQRPVEVPPAHPAAPTHPAVWTATPAAIPPQTQQPLYPAATTAFATAWQPAMDPPQPAPQPQIWRQPMSTAPTAAMQPATELPHHDDDGDLPQKDYVPAHMQVSPLKHLMLGALMMVVLGGGLWVWWDAVHSKDDLVVDPPVPAALPGTDAPEIRRAALPTTSETAEATLPPLNVLAIRDDIRKCSDKLFHSNDMAAKIDAIHEGTRHAAEIEAWLSPKDAKPPSLIMLASIKGTASLLPGGTRMPLFHLTTSGCAEGAIIRGIEGTDSVWRIHWPLLQETHDQMLPKAIAAHPDQPVWAWVLLKPSHGFEISASERERFITYALHVSAGGRQPFIACAERDTPLGRYLDRETDWGQAYLTRLLVRRMPTASGAVALLIVDCEGATLPR